MSMKVEGNNRNASIEERKEIEHCQIQKSDWIFGATLNLPHREKPVRVHFFRAIQYLWSHKELEGCAGFFKGLWNWRELFQSHWKESHTNPESEITNLEKLNLSIEKARTVWDKLSTTTLKSNEQYLKIEHEDAKAIIYRKKDGTIRQYVWTPDMQLGEGATKTAFKAIDPSTGKFRVIPEMSQTVGSGFPWQILSQEEKKNQLEKRKENFETALSNEEILKPILQENNVPFVCRAKKIFTTEHPDRPAFFTYCDSGTLASRITKGLTPTEKKQYATQLFTFLNALHTKAKIVHRDLKPDNILLHKGENLNPDLMVADFEMWDEISQKAETTFAGTPEYCSIELNSQFLTEGSKTYPEAYHDLWAAGVTLYEIQTGKLPVSESTCRELYAASKEPNSTRLKNALTQYRKELEQSLKKLKNDPIDEAIRKLLVEEKKEQLSASKILQILK